MNKNVLYHEGHDLYDDLGRYNGHISVDLFVENGNVVYEFWNAATEPVDVVHERYSIALDDFREGMKLAIENGEVKIKKCNFKKEKEDIIYSADGYKFQTD